MKRQLAKFNPLNAAYIFEEGFLTLSLISVLNL
jgi:hypothetical protein